jgi:mono/diheme cytochrome c family protein
MILGIRTLVLLAALVVTTPSHGEDPEIKAGRDRYLSMCSVCHGLDARGDGPYTGLLTLPPADLTMLSENHGGRFPETYVRRVIDGRELSVHGRRDMPIWGAAFEEERPGMDSAAYVQGILDELVAYLRTLQR